MSHDEQQKPAVETYGFFLYLGMLVGGCGAATLWHWSRGHQEITDLKHYSALGAVVAGVVFCYLSSLPKAEAISWLRSGITALAVAFAFRWAVGEPYRIPSSSMEPTLNGDERAFRGDRVWVNKWWYGWKWPFSNQRIFHLHEPQRWDIVVFNNVNPDAAHPVLVKRVVGLPGERINIHDGVIHVNGKPVELGPGMPPVFYTSNDPRMRYGVSRDDEYAVVPPGHYLVCGDNSANSADGRYFGWLPNENIIGRVACIWWPIPNRHDFTGFTQTLWWRGIVGALCAWIFVRLFIGRSYPAYAPDGKSIDHFWVSFIAYGLRVPLLGRFAVRWRTPQRGDYVLYGISGDGIPQGTQIAARVAGLPGESIDLSNGAVLVNGAALPADTWPGAGAYTIGNTNTALKVSYAALTLDRGEYFLLSDDAADVEPYDSRILGPTPLSVIAGRLTRRWWPLKRAEKL